MSKNELFDKFGLQVQEGQVEVGRIYPLYGMITKIIDETFENFTIEINHGIVLNCFIKEKDSVDKIKERAFEPGIFITEITGLEPVSGKCNTIVFGRKQNIELV